MSVQLILYPQSYTNTSSNYTSTMVSSKQEYIPDPNFITSIMGSSTAWTSGSMGIGGGLNIHGNSMITGTAHSIVGLWQGFYASSHPTYHTTTTPTINLQSSSGGILTIPGSSAGSPTRAGAYQTISGLTVGTVYDLEITTHSTNASTSLFIDGDIVSPFVPLTTGAGTFSTLVAAGSPGSVLAVVNNHNSNLVINKISLKETTGQSITTYQDLSDGQVICDLYEDESIPLSLSVDDFKNVAEKVQSYSKDFHLPATKRNNKIFTHLFEITRSVNEWAFDFNPYIKTRAILKEDSYVIFEGFLKLIDIIEKGGERSYNVNLYSEAVSLMDTLKDKYFADIDLNELSHEYNITNIKASWTGALALVNALPTGTLAGTAGASTTAVLKYPFVRWEKMELQTTSVPHTPELTRLEEAFRPFIQVKYLIDRIFKDIEMTYTSTIFDSTDFKKLFMDFNWGDENSPSDFLTTGTIFNLLGTNISDTSFQIWTFNQYNVSTAVGWSVADNWFQATNDNTTYTIDYDLAFDTTTTNQTVEFEWVRTDASGAVLNRYDIYSNTYATATTNQHYQGIFTTNPSLNNTDKLYVIWKATAVNGATLHQPAGSIVNISINVAAVPNSRLLNTIRGDLNQWEFLRGIMNMFNLVTLQDKDNPKNLIIETYEEVFLQEDSGTTLAERKIQHDWTEKVDISDIKLKPLDLTKETIFKYDNDEDDYALKVYKKAFSDTYEYGSKNFPETSHSANKFNLLQGKKEIKATPFSATVIKPLEDHLSDFIIPVIYTANEEATEFEGFDNNPRILYDIGTVTLGGGITYSIPTQNGVPAIPAETQFRQFAHLSEIPTTASTIDYNFSSKQLISPVGQPPVDNLYNIYWSPYYDELYHPDTRIMTLKVNLTPADINKFQFSEKVLIKNRSFRVNKIEYKAGELAKVEFILIP